MASIIASSIFWGLILASLIVPWLRKLPAWGALILANFVIHGFVVIHDSRVETLQDSISGVWRFYPVLVQELSVAALPRFVSSMFLHADFGHVIGNMMVLGFVGFHLEERIGPRWFISIYLLGGVLASVISFAANYPDLTPALGASGAVFAVLGFLGGAFPLERFRLPVMAGIILFLRMRGWVAAIVAGAFQFVFLLMFTNVNNVGYWAHLGGLAAGMLLGIASWKHFHQEPTKQETAPLDLSRLVTTPEARRIDANIQANADDAVIRDLWLDQFAKKIPCPTCNGQLTRTKQTIVCSKCDDAP